MERIVLMKWMKKIPHSYAWIISMMVSIVLVTIFGFTLIILYKRWKMYQDFFKQLKLPTVLLVYHPESQSAMDFVTTLAEFLKTTCCVKSLMADNYVGNKNPINWIKTQMNEADRILFVIPMDCEAESCTPLRNQWKVALDHCTGYEYTTSPGHFKRLAKLMLPNSSEVPCQIKTIRQFDLTHHPAALANWMHDGVFPDQFFLWRPRIQAYKNLKPSWADVRSAAKMITSASTKSSDEFNILPLDNFVEMSNSTVEQKDSNNSSSEYKECEDDESSISLVMDPDIPGYEMLCESFKRSNKLLDDLVIEDGDGIFT